MENINSLGETANDLLDKLSWDYATFSGFGLKVIWGNDGYIKELYHIPFTNIRVGTPNEDGKIEYFVVSNNWDGQLTQTREYVKKYPIFNPSYFKDGVPTKTKSIQGLEIQVPEPTEIQLEQSEQMIYYWKYKPHSSSSNEYYPTPDYMGSTDSVLTEIDSILSNKSKMKNGLGGKTLVVLPQTNQSEEAKAEFQQDFTGNFTGVENDGSIIIEYADDPSQVNITQLNPVEPDTYINVATSAKQDIITAHLIPAILLEVNFGGGFNNRAEEMKVAFDNYQRSVIKELQNDICRNFNTLAKWFGYNGQTFNIIPFTLEYSTDNSDGKTSLKDA
jgi:hypothetical protein